MNDRLYKYLWEEKLLYSKQFGFQKGHYKDHSIVQSLAQIYESFENNNCTLEVFVDQKQPSRSVLRKRCSENMH